MKCMYIRYIVIAFKYTFCYCKYNIHINNDKRKMMKVFVKLND